MGKPIDDCSLDQLTGMEPDSQFFPSGTPPCAMLARCEISLGQVVGQGGFSVVSELNDVILEDLYDTSNEQAQLRTGFVEKCCGGTDQYFVLKTLRDDLPEEEHAKGIVDLAIEAKFLASLHHKHIVCMRAIANSDPLQDHFFVVLDRLEATLDERLDTWRTQVMSSSPSSLGGVWEQCVGMCCSKRPNQMIHLWVERLVVAQQIAFAMQYLHKKDIVYRDLKPDNVGFSAEGAVKLFDFGLAKKLLEVDKVGGTAGMESDLYLLTGNTGSLRYMAPEVALGRPYNNKVDSYSFGILFWQICALALPYAGYDVDMHADLVVDQGYRPRLDDSWPGPWVDLMTNCWGSDIPARPDFDFLVHLMTQEVAEMKLEATESQNSVRQTTTATTTDHIHHAQSFGSAEKEDNAATSVEPMDMQTYDPSRIVNNLKGNTETDSIMTHHEVC
mmetsp:Transcript_14621/g.26516  ORF Transcript_14621/g.26516 Transcript_14621/m.26516 type:complete len:444 (-) Transcript_14621:467-1798(-)